MSYKVVYEFDPFDQIGTDRPSSKKETRKALEEIAEYVKTEILQYVGEAQSPVSGGRWKQSLSPEYKKLKKEISGSAIANMELYGDMLDALEARVVGNKIKVGWFGGEQAAKADGHNNFSGESSLPTRQSIPKEGQKFKRDIMQGIKEIAQEFIDED
jgi:hypothetical protein